MKKTDMSQKIKICAAVGFAILLLLQILALLTIDVGKNVGDTSIGLQTLNKSVFALLGEHKFFDKLTDVLLILSILTAAAFAGLGVFQAIKRKSLKEVDVRLYVLAGLYVAMAIVYLFFEVVHVNCRPIMEDGVAKASFPSSHTLVITVIMGSAMLLLENYIANTKLRAALQIICGSVVCAAVLGRLLSGMHWYTDVIGALLAAGMLLSLFSFFADFFSPREEGSEEDASEEEEAEQEQEGEEEKTKII